MTLRSVTIRFVRTVQRWESAGLPIKRPHPGKRSHVVADSSQLDSWAHDNAFWRAKDRNPLDTIVRNRMLREETRQARADLHLKIQELRKEMTALRQKASTKGSATQQSRPLEAHHD